MCSTRAASLLPRAVPWVSSYSVPNAGDSAFLVMRSQLQMLPRPLAEMLYTNSHHDSMLSSRPLQTASRLVRIFTLHPAHPRPTLQTLDLPPVPAIIAKMPLRRPARRRRRNMRSSIRQRGRSEQRVELGLAYGRRHMGIDGEQRVVVEAHARGGLRQCGRRRRGSGFRRRGRHRGDGA